MALFAESRAISSSLEQSLDELNYIVDIVRLLYEFTSDIANLQVGLGA